MKIQEVSEHASKVLKLMGWLQSRLKCTGLLARLHIPLSDSASSENKGFVDLRVLYIVDSAGFRQSWALGNYTWWPPPPPLFNPSDMHTEIIHN